MPKEVRDKDGRVMRGTVEFVPSEPPMQGFRRYRVRYRIHDADGDSPERTTTLDAFNPEHAKEKLQALKHYLVPPDGIHPYPNMENSITITIAEIQEI